MTDSSESPPARGRRRGRRRARRLGSSSDDASPKRSRSRSNSVTRSAAPPGPDPADAAPASTPPPPGRTGLRILFRPNPDDGAESFLGTLGLIQTLFGAMDDADAGAPDDAAPLRPPSRGPMRTPPLLLIPSAQSPFAQQQPLPPPPPPPRRAGARRNEYAPYMAKLSKDEREYFNGLDDAEKRRLVAAETALADAAPDAALTPLRFKILNSVAPTPIKNVLLAKLKQSQNMFPGMGEYHKTRNWLTAAASLPFGKYHPLPVRADVDPVPEIARYLTGVRATLDRTVFGHAEAKDQILRLLAQWISHPTARGAAIGIQGPKGVGKTSLVKHGLCEALGLPFGFIALGGASDGSFLEGHSITYEGSTHGKIAEILIHAGVMNPVLFFDELDKVSQTHRGDEIIGVLTHLTDASQNDRFSDRYFSELPLDLSKSIIVFAYNDIELVNPILRDRMVTIHVTGYSTAEKVRIARDYLLPEILAEYNLRTADIVFPTAILERLIQDVPSEEGVRNLRRALDAIVGWINMARYLPPAPSEGPSDRALPTSPTAPPIAFPLTITEAHVREYLKKSSAHLGPTSLHRDLARAMYT